MKILIISHEYPPVGGGGANACYNLSIEYARMGHVAHVVSVWYPGCEDNDRKACDPGESKDGFHGSLTIHRIRSPRKYPDHSTFYEMFMFMLMADGVCRKLEREIRFDICHVFFAIPSGPVAYRLKHKFGLPYVVRYGGGDIPGAQKRFKFIYKFIAPFERRIWHEAAALVANSDGLRKRALAFDDRMPIQVIPNGVNMPDTVADNGIIDDTFRLLFVSRLIEGKGLQDIFPDLRELDNRCRQIGKSIKYTIVGDGPYRQAYEDLVHQLEIQDLVEFTGHKQHDELEYYYLRSDLFVFPSRSEGMPNVVLEAMSYGLPVVMTPCEGSTELIHDNGYIAGADEFSDRIYDLIVDEELRHRFSDASVRIAKDDFSWTSVAEAYLDLFREAIS